MPLNRANCRTFHRCLYAGILETITLLKRNDDQQQGTVRAIKVYNCRRSPIYKTGQTLQHDMVSNHRIVWHLWAIDLQRVGVNFISPLDRIVDNKGRYWQPESTTMITVKLFEQEFHLDCLAVNPPVSGQMGS